MDVVMPALLGNQSWQRRLDRYREGHA